MNSNEIFSRLEGLMKKLSMSSERGSYTRAEMKAYAAGSPGSRKYGESFKKSFYRHGRK